MQPEFPDVLPERDRRALRLFDLEPHQSIQITCGCGWSTTYMYGLLQRQHRMPSDTLVWDLQFRLKCRHCNLTRGFEIALLDERERGTTTKDRPMSKTIVVPKGD